MRRLAPLLLAACGHAAATAPPPAAPAANHATAAPTAPAVPSDRVDAVLYDRPFVPQSAVAVGIMQDGNGLDAKTIILSEAPTTCAQATAAGADDDNHDRTIAMSMIGWKDGHVTTFTDESGTWSATFNGLPPALADDPDAVRSFEIATGTVTTIKAATAVGGTGRVRFDLHTADGDDHARGEIDVVQCE